MIQDLLVDAPLQFFPIDDHGIEFRKIEVPSFVSDINGQEESLTIRQSKQPYHHSFAVEFRLPLEDNLYDFYHYSWGVDNPEDQELAVTTKEVGPDFDKSIHNEPLRKFGPDDISLLRYALKIAKEEVGKSGQA